MSALVWNKDKYTVCVQELDKQHEVLIGQLNKLHSAMKIGKSNEVLGEILDELVNYTSWHFCTEENYFCKFNYENMEEHISQHQLFTEKVIEFKKEFEEGKTNLSIGILRFLSDWLDNHIRVTDKKYTACFNENGLK